MNRSILTLGIVGGLALGAAVKKRGSLSADMTSTPAFRRWFGNSKVVDGAGRPLVVYHGTDAEFDVFDSTATSKRWSRKGRLLGEGFYFTSDPRTAASYGNTVIAVYLRIENPRTHGTDGRLSIPTDDQDGTIASGVPGTRRGELVFVVKSPTQIKSVENRGTFDPADSRISYNRSTA